MTAVNMPTYPGFTACRYFLETNSQRFESPLTKTVQRVILGGARWNATYSLPPMNRAQAAPWMAFFLLLEGSVNTFNAFDPDKKLPRGKSNENPLVNGASQTGSSLTIDGLSPNITLWRAGDLINIGLGGELKMVTADVIIDGSGNGTVNFKPAMRSSPADDAFIYSGGNGVPPSCTMTLTDDNQAIWDCDKYGIYQAKTFTAVEVFS